MSAKPASKVRKMKSLSQRMEILDKIQNDPKVPPKGKARARELLEQGRELREKQEKFMARWEAARVES